MTSIDRFFQDHRELTRRYFLGAGISAAAASMLPFRAEGAERAKELLAAIDELEQYLTAQNEFRDVSRGKPIPHSLTEDKRKEVGLTPETWQLEVLPDTEHKPDMRNPLSKEKGNALNWDGLMELAKQHAVSFPKVMTCNNIGCPLGMGIWEGVPLREVIWLTKPRKNVRRVFYNGYHNDDPKQMFRGSLPIGRVLEDPFGLPPVILCYKLNGELLTPERGGPVRLVAPENYGFKSVKWLTHVYLSNLFHANDTYANGNNDIDSWLKTFAATLTAPNDVPAGEPIPVTGYTQVGISGLSRVQAWIVSAEEEEEWDPQDRYFTKAPWKDAEILSPPDDWGGTPDGKIPGSPLGFDADTKRPVKWPMRLAKAHWAILFPGLPAGEYTLRCRTIDEYGNAQPMPRPFDKSGRNSIESISFKVT